MFAQTLSSVYKSTSLLLKNLISLNLSCTKKKMSTLENVILRLNDVRRRIKEATERGVQVFVYRYLLRSFRELMNIGTTVIFCKVVK